MRLPAQNSKSIYARFFLRTLPLGTRFIGSESVPYKVIGRTHAPAIIHARDSIFNLVWDLDGEAIVRVLKPS